MSIERLGPQSTDSQSVRRSTTTNWGLWLRTVDNLVVMGMGEPLANYDNLLQACAFKCAVGGALAPARSPFHQRPRAAFAGWRMNRCNSPRDIAARRHDEVRNKSCR